MVRKVETDGKKQTSVVYLCRIKKVFDEIRDVVKVTEALRRVHWHFQKSILLVLVL